MKKLSKLLILVLCFAFVWMVGCDEEPTPTPQPVDEITTFTATIAKADTTVYLDESETITWTVVENINYADVVATCDTNVATVTVSKDGLLVKAVNEGNTTIFIQYPNCSECYKINVKVMERPQMIENVTFNDVPTELKQGESFTIKYTVGVAVSAAWSISDEAAASIDQSGKVKVLNGGKVTVTLVLTTKDDEKTYTFDIDCEKIPDSAAPVFNIDGTTQDAKVLWGKDFDPLDGITAIDDIDGNVTNKITVTGEVDTKKYGTYDLVYTVEDNAGNKATLERKIEVYWGYNVKFIGHAGSFFGAQNSIEACEYALKELQYQALECDLKVTSDGVYVCCHNDYLTGTDDVKYTIANYTLAQLQAKKFKETRNDGGNLVGNGKITYTFDIMTLEDYLLICKKYNATAIIELKGCNGVSQSDTSGMQKLMDLIEDCDMRGQTIFLASAYNTLIWTRENGYDDIPCQYLMSTCDSSEAYDRAVKYGFDISICVTYGNYIDKMTESERKTYRETWIKKYQDAGCQVSVWTFTQYCTIEQVQEWIDYGVDWVTCDWQPMDKCNLDNAGYSNVHTVKFYDYDGTLLKTSTVKDGKAAVAPTKVVRDGYEFTGWDKPVTEVTEDLEVTAQYKAVTYNITYDLNLYVENGGTKYYLTRANATAPTTNSYTILDEITLDAPVSTLTFEGWYENAECTGTAVTKIEKGNFGDKKYYAKWSNLSFEENKSAITYHLDNGVNSENNGAEYVEGIVTKLSAATKTGYKFLGWSLTSGGTEYITEISDRTSGDIDLYANYEIIKYSISYAKNGGQWGINPQASGSAVGTTTTSATSNIKYFDGTKIEGKTYSYANCVFLYLSTDANKEKAKFAEKIYFKCLANNYYEIVDICASGEHTSHADSDWDVLVQVSDGNSSEYSKLTSIAGDLIAGDIAIINADFETGVGTIEYYKVANVSGLSVDNLVTSYTVEDTNVVLPTIEKDGYTFVGWSLSSEGTDPFTVLPAGLTGTLTLYAVYQAN